MKHTTKKLFSVGLALLLLVSIFASSVSAATLNPTKDYSKYEGNTYISLGDSVPAGFNVAEHPNDHGFKEVEGSYPQVLGKALDAEHLSFSCTGFRSMELADILGADISADTDAYHEYVTQKYYNSIVNKTTSEILEAVKEAQLVTVTVGSNDIFTSVLVNAYLETIADLKGQKEYQTCVDGLYEIIENYPAAEQITKAMELLGSLEKSVIFVENMAHGLATGVQQYYKYFPKVISILNDNMPEDGTIIVTSLFNPYKGIDIDGGVTNLQNIEWDSEVDLEMAIDLVSALAKLTDASGAMVNTVNAFLKHNAGKSGYIYVDVTQAELYSDLKSTSTAQESETDSTDLFPLFIRKAGDPHPTEAGNEYIAQQIIDKLPVKDKAVAAPAEVVKAEPTLKDVALLYQWYIGNTTLPDDVQSSCDLNDNGSIDLVDVSMAYWMVVSGK